MLGFVIVAKNNLTPYIGDSSLVFLHVYSAACLTFTAIAGVILILIF